MGSPTVTSYTDSDRVRLATPSTVGRARRLGPKEIQECADHPGHTEAYRWFWDDGDGPENGDCEMLSQCPLCRASDLHGEVECSWCGGVCDQPRPFLNRAGEVFCSPSHRSASNRALKRFLERAEVRHG